MWWAVLALFPVLIVTLIRINPVDAPRNQGWTIILFMLVPMLVSMLGTFLWTTPAVATELERKSWVYLAVRPLQESLHMQQTRSLLRPQGLPEHKWQRTSVA